MILKKSDDAISPVIGIMLMLAVTVIIAAAVIMVSTGLMTDTEPAPTAKLDIVIDSEYEMLVDSYSKTKYYIPNMLITHVSGDSLNTADLRLTFTWDCPHGSSCKYTDDGHHYSTYAYEDKPNGYDADYTLSPSGDGMFGIYGVFLPSGYVGSVQPLYINGGSFAGEYFGSFTMQRGDTLNAFGIHLIQPWYYGKYGTTYHHKGNPALDIILYGKVLTYANEEEGDVDFAALGFKPCTEDNCPGFLIYDYYYSYERYTYCTECDYYGAGNSAGYVPGDIKGMPCKTSGCPGAYCYEDWDGYYCLFCSEAYSGSEDPGDYLPGQTVAGELTPGIMNCLPQGTPVDVKVIHIPSNKPIYSKTVYVQ